MYINGRWLIEPEIRDYIHKLEEERDELKQENSVILHETDRIIKEKGKLIEKNEKLKKLLKAAVEGFKTLVLKSTSDCNMKIMCDECPLSCRNDNLGWKKEAEALKLIGGNDNA